MKVKCAVCGITEFENDDTLEGCPVCGWFNDGVQSDDPNYAGGCNELSLNEYRKQWKEKQTAEHKADR